MGNGESVRAEMIEDRNALKHMMLDYITDLMREHEGSGFTIERDSGAVIVTDEEGQEYHVVVLLMKIPVA